MPSLQKCGFPGSDRAGSRFFTTHFINVTVGSKTHNDITKAIINEISRRHLIECKASFVSQGAQIDAQDVN